MKKEPTYLIRIIGYKEDGTPIVEPYLTDKNRKRMEKIIQGMNLNNINKELE